MDPTREPAMITGLPSATRAATTSPEGSTVIIGERINPTGRKKLGEALIADDLEMVRRDAIAQVQAGARILDVSSSYPGIDEPAMIVEAVKAVMRLADVPICLDSANPEVVGAALGAYRGEILLSSLTDEPRTKWRRSSLWPSPPR